MIVLPRFSAGGAVIFWFTGAATQAVSTGAYRAVEFIKRNIKLDATTTKASLGAGRPISANYGIESAYLNEARQNLLGLRAQLSAAEADTRRLVHEAWFRFDKAGRDEAVSRDKVVPLAVTDLDTIAAGYSAGKLFFADLVEATSRWFEARQTWERQRADLGIARAELEEAVGVALGQE